MKRLAVIAFLAIALPSFAYDFESKRPEGYSLFFNIFPEENEVEVTYPEVSGNSYWYGHRMPWGEVEIPSTVEYDGTKYTVVAIGDHAFTGCNEITSIKLPATVTDIGSYAFSQCTGITGTLTIGEKIATIGSSAFYGCSGITVLIFNALKCEMMGGSRSTTAFGNCRNLSTVKFGPKVRRIPDYAFAGMDMLTNEWQMPKNLEYIGEMAFAYCYSISGTLNLPEGVKHIAQHAFAQCHSMQKVVIPASMVKIESGAFYRCVKLATIDCKAIVPPELGSGVFAEIPEGASLNVPCVSANEYRQHKGWNTVGIIQTTNPCILDLVVRVNDSKAGIVTGGGRFKLGSSAVITAVCRAGYGFKCWSDGNTANPRTVTINDTTSYTAIMQKTEVVHEVQYVHDTTYMDGKEVVIVYYEVLDVAEPINSQKKIVYNRDKSRLEIPLDNNNIVDLALYNDAGLCIMTGKPRHGHINMRRYPTGNYVIRVTTIDDEIILRFFHRKNK